jgi:PadR family transcriptional regulator PadR
MRSAKISAAGQRTCRRHQSRSGGPLHQTRPAVLLLGRSQGGSDTLILTGTYVRILPMPEARITLAVALVLQEFLEDASKPRYGYDIMTATGFPSGKIYPILARLQKAGWLVREREIIDPSQLGRPARTLYRLSEQGAEAASNELERINQKLVPRLRSLPGLAPETGTS